MISKANAEKYCAEDISLIENYKEAVSSKELYHCHHRLEIQDDKCYFEAIKNVKKFNLEDRITLIYNDALEIKLKDKYDLIFIDAAKSKNQDIFEHFARNLSDKGAVVTDNLSFHGFVNKETNEIKNRNIRGLVRKIKNYISFLNQNDDYKTVFYEIGDGISVTTKK